MFINSKMETAAGIYWISKKITRVVSGSLSVETLSSQQTEADDLTKQTNVTDQKLLNIAKSEVYLVSRGMAVSDSTPTSVKIGISS